jgi:hypothetical protein
MSKGALTKWPQDASDSTPVDYTAERSKSVPVALPTQQGSFASFSKISSSGLVDLESTGTFFTRIEMRSSV